MQGFNRYIPPDYDPKANSTLNSHQGKKHALGNRAKDIDKGILVVRFELPFNIWCGSCNAHIGAGVRYNAQKQKVGNYYSTPIFGFRCKCHLCQNWFELRTDPKNAAYVVHEGATRKDEDWDPEENGGFAVHDTEAPSAAEPPADPFAHIEKTIDQQTWAQTKKTRLSELYDASDRLSSDPYLVSSALRRKFRVEKGLMLDRQRRDDEFRDKYGLSLELDLGGETPVGNVKGMWEAGRERRGLPSHTGEASGSGAGVSTRATKGTPSRKGKERDMDGFKTKAQLAQSLRATTSRKYDPFASAADTLLAGSPGGSSAGLKVKTKTKDPDKVAQVNTGVRPIGTGVSISSPVVGSLGGGLLAGYGSD